MGFWEEPKNGFLGRAQIKNLGGGGGKIKPNKRICAFGIGLRNENKQEKKHRSCVVGFRMRRERERRRKRRLRTRIQKE